MKKPKCNSPKSKQQSSRNNKRRAGDKPALIKQSTLKKSRLKGMQDSCPNPNPFGIRVINGITILTSEAIDYQYREIRRIFFPGFDRKQSWVLSQTSSHYFIACTFCKTKTIVYSHQLLTQSILVLNVILIHELCHAALGDRVAHGKRWRDRMFEASEVAASIRDMNLAIALMAESRRYDPHDPHYVPPVNARTCYKSITQWANEEPDWSFEDVMYWVARSCYEPPEFLIKKFKKCRQVFEKAKKEVKDAASVRDEP